MPRLWMVARGKPFVTAYYNENDPFAAEWLRKLIARGLIAPGEVDERSIRDVRSDDLRGFTQCHFFAGIGVWSYALRQAGWPDDRPVWTGSCPCQPFSAAGKRKGAADDRHLWPVWFPLIQECRPVTVFGEQVASKDGLSWLDLVSSDLEGAGYTVGAVDTCAAGVGAPHIRQRLYFVADRTRDGRREECADLGRLPEGDRAQGLAAGFESGCSVGELADARSTLRKRRTGEQRPLSKDSSQWNQETINNKRSGTNGRVGESDSAGPQQGNETAAAARQGNPSYTAGFWAECSWLPCIDGKSRPVEPGSFPLVNGTPNRVGRLRGYGNALCAPQAQAFIEAFVELQQWP